MLYIQNNVVLTKCCTLPRQLRIVFFMQHIILYSIASTTVNWGLCKLLLKSPSKYKVYSHQCSIACPWGEFPSEC